MPACACPNGLKPRWAAIETGLNHGVGYAGGNDRGGVGCGEGQAMLIVSYVLIFCSCLQSLGRFAVKDD